jgi:hypothetical protein
MTRRPFELVHGGARCIVVPRAWLDTRPSELAARWLVEDALREGGIATAAALERLAESLVGRTVESTREAAQIVIRGLVEARLVAVQWPTEERTLAGVEVTDLRTLGNWEVDEPGRPGGPPAPPPPVPVESTTWVSFEVVDERGEAADGRYRIGLDAHAEEGEIARRGHRFDGLREAVRVQLLVEDLRWDPTAQPNAPWRGDDPRPSDDGLFSVELVDERGEPLRARFTLSEGERRLAEGTLDHRWRRALPGGEPVTLTLSELRPQGDPR